MLKNSLKLIIFAASVCAAVNASTIFTFDNDVQGTSTTFTDTVNGLAATFSSSADPGGFVLYPTVFQTLTGNVLGDPGPAGSDNLKVDIAFSSNLNAITLNFATADFSKPSPLTISAYENSTLVGSNILSGQSLAGSTFPEGEIAFSGATFNNVVISSTATDFAVDNIAVVASAAAPEPAVFGLVGISLLCAGVPALRKSRHQQMN
jgi:hypothetical protein